MRKKRKHSETADVAVPKKDEAAPERPARTLLGWKDKSEVNGDVEHEDSPVFRNKEKVLVTCSRHIYYRYRHLMLNVVSLLPHCKKDNKVESKETKGATLNELVELKNCSSYLFFECRKGKDLYLWMGKCPNGPSVKFLVSAVHTMEELKLTGNHLKVDDHIWFRNYQIDVPHNETDKLPRGGLEQMNLVEVGPRFWLNPIKIFGGSFGGPTLYENPFYVSPNQVLAYSTIYLYFCSENSSVCTGCVHGLTMLVYRRFEH
ncbi:Ribosome biogenesis protein BRX1 1 [Stylosanthes scabra]|uniref:Ribosome biogenesis protein BRX1 1 n=1 Tax=Stylosanthes scabra TaxID=79078 RepID=A0ABU6QD43_9FABA|nr:Ribosome biogenesis protein BRX1 1 [Stylosanthes scabra]